MASPIVAEAVCVAAVLVLGALRAQARARTTDIGFDDEIMYLEFGTKLLSAGPPSADWSPVYAIWYYLISLVARDPVAIYYANLQALTILSIVSLYAVLRVSGAGRPVAVIVTACTASLHLFAIWPYPTYFAAAVLVATAVMGAVLPPRWRAFGLVVGLLLATYVRPELALATYAVVAVLIGARVLDRVRGRTSTRSFALFTAAILGPLVVFSAFFGSPVSNARSFYAFSQHYVLNVVREGHLDFDPWTNWYPVSHRDFGNATTIAEAARANPRAFVWHVMTNLRILPRGLAELFIPGSASHIQDGLSVVLAAICVLGAVGAVFRVLRRGPAEPPGRHGVFIVAAAVFASTTLSSVVISPREHYLVPGVLFGLGLLGGSLLWVPRVGAWASSRWAEGIALVVALCAVPCAALAGGGDPVREGLRTVETLRALSIKRDVVILEPDYSRAFCAGMRFRRVAQWDKTEGFDAFLRDRGIDVIVINGRLRYDPRFRDDPEFVRFDRASGPIDGFELIPVEGTSARIAVRRDLLR